MTNTGRILVATLAAAALQVSALAADPHEQKHMMNVHKGHMRNVKEHVVHTQKHMMNVHKGHMRNVKEHVVHNQKHMMNVHKGHMRNVKEHVHAMKAQPK